MLVENPLYAYQYNFKKADWKKINEEILSKQDNKKFQWSLIEITEEALKLEAEKLQKLILEVIEKHISKKKFYEKSKPWWSEKLTKLRKEIAKYRRKWKKNTNSTAENKYIDIKR